MFQILTVFVVAFAHAENHELVGQIDPTTSTTTVPVGSPVLPVLSTMTTAHTSLETTYYTFPTTAELMVTSEAAVGSLLPATITESSLNETMFPVEEDKTEEKSFGE